MLNEKLMVTVNPALSLNMLDEERVEALPLEEYANLVLRTMVYQAEMALKHTAESTNQRTILLAEAFNQTFSEFLHEVFMESPQDRIAFSVFTTEAHGMTLDLGASSEEDWSNWFDQADLSDRMVAAYGPEGSKTVSAGFHPEAYRLLQEVNTACKARVPEFQERLNEIIGGLVA